VYAFFERLIDPLTVHPEADRPPSTTLGFFRRYVMPVRGVVAAALLLGTIATVCELYLYIYLGWLLDWMTATGDAPRDHFLVEHGAALVVMLVVIGVVRPLAVLGGRALINLSIGPGLANATRWQNHRYVLRQSLGFFQDDFAGRISQKVLATGHSLREAVVNLLDGASLLLIYLIGIAAMFSTLAPALLWPVLLWSGAYVAVIVTQVPSVRRRSAALSEANSGLTGRVVDSYTNIQSVKLFAHDALEERFAAEGIRRHTDAFRQMMRSILTMTVLLTVLNTALVLGTATLSILLWMRGSISVGEIAAANGLIIRLNQMSGWILRSITSLFEHVGTVQNGIETISRPQAVTDRPSAAALRVPRGEVRFERVSFGYQGDAPAGRSRTPLPVLDAFDLLVRPGERIGLVGRSGAGKSTIVNLLLRFHDVAAGSVRVDGQDVREISQHSLRRAIAVVTQDTSLLHRSIRDNIRYGQAEASDEQVLEAARRASALDFIETLTDRAGRRGLDAHVGERGVKLSGGQRQRIAIARVILKNAPILVLDEATSALDSEVEATIQQQLDELMHGKTVIAVAHRLSTIAALDRLVVLDQGRVVETGTHAQLLDADGVYARLWSRQSGGFIGV